MPEFGFAGRSTVVYRTVNHQATADAAVGVGVKNRTAAHPGAKPDFGQRRHVRIIVNRNRGRDQVREPVAEIPLIPTCHLPDLVIPSRDAVIWRCYGERRR